MFFSFFKMQVLRWKCKTVYLPTATKSISIIIVMSNILCAAMQIFAHRDFISKFDQRCLSKPIYANFNAITCRGIFYIV